MKRNNSKFVDCLRLNHLKPSWEVDGIQQTTKLKFPGLEYYRDRHNDLKSLGEDDNIIRDIFSLFLHKILKTNVTYERANWAFSKIHH